MNEGKEEEEELRGYEDMRRRRGYGIGGGG